MQIEEEGCYPPRVKTEVDNILRVYNIYRAKCFAYSCFFFRSVLVRNSAISSSDNRESHFPKTLDNTDLKQVVASSGFSENKDLGQGVLSLAGLIKSGLGHSYLRIFAIPFFSSVVYKQHGGRA